MQKLAFKPETELEKFGMKAYGALVENFPETFFVGGTVRDFLLKKKIKDIDIATEARPEQTAETLKKYFIGCNLGFAALGVVIATNGRQNAAIATLRKDLKSPSRYPKIIFVRDAKTDAGRRDFTINSLYFSPKTGKILDFYSGIKDLKTKKIKFIGPAKKRIVQDPLRIIRALRLCLQLGFRLEQSAKLAIKNNFRAAEQLTKNKIQKEIEKLKNRRLQKIISLVLDKPKLLDKYF